MYRIVKDGATVGITGALNYIKLQDNGCYGLCSEAEAQGVAFGGVPYQLESKIEMGGLDVVTVVEENDVDISGDHLTAAQVFVEQAEAGNIDENTALQHKGLFGEWSGNSIPVYDGTDKEHRQTWVRGKTSGLLYKCRLSHTTQEDWPPEATPNMWVVVDVTHAGTIDDPIPAERGMEYTYGLYYYDSEVGEAYLCERTGEAEGGTVVLHAMPHQLVGNYFSLVTD